MKRLLFGILCLCLLFNKKVSAQQADQVLGKAYYSFSHKRDTSNLDYIYTENMILYLGKYSSMYKSYDRFQSDSLMQIKFKGPNAVSVAGSSKGGTNATIFLNFLKKEALVQDVLMNKYVYPINFPVINWKIEKETMMISGQNCQKAIGEFKGRIYEVWFCRDIPYTAGPWKLSGLPGLIFKAVDTRKHVSFELTGFTQYKGPVVLIKPDVNSIATTRENYLKVFDLFYSNPTAFIKTSMPQIKDIKLPSNYKRKSPINNPLELVKK
jgi:GLPGLI family protein